MRPAPSPDMARLPVPQGPVRGHAYTSSEPAVVAYTWLESTARVWTPSWNAADASTTLACVPLGMTRARLPGLARYTHESTESNTRFDGSLIGLARGNTVVRRVVL